MIASTPVSASARPSPVTTSTPVERDIGDDLVAALLEHVDDVAADPAGRACDGDLLRCTHDALLGIRPALVARAALGGFTSLTPRGGRT